MNWYIGQEIVCVDASNKSGFAPSQLKEGKVYTIRGVRVSKCKCKGTEIDVGHNTIYGSLRCWICECREITNTVYYRESRFAPLQDLTEQISELLEQKITI